METADSKIYIDKATLLKALEEYFLTVFQVDRSDIPIIMSDCQDPYCCEWISQDFTQEEKIDGKLYQVRACYTNFNPYEFMSFNNDKRFMFYMLFQIVDGEADYWDEDRRLYRIENLDPEDFPKY